MSIDHEYRGETGGLKPFGCPAVKPCLCHDFVSSNVTLGAKLQIAEAELARTKEELKRLTTPMGPETPLEVRRAERIAALTADVVRKTGLTHLLERQIGDEIAKAKNLRKAVDEAYTEVERLKGKYERETSVCNDLEGDICKLSDKVERLKGEVEIATNAADDLAGAIMLGKDGGRLRDHDPWKQTVKAALTLRANRGRLAATLAKVKEYCGTPTYDPDAKTDILAIIAEGEKG